MSDRAAPGDGGEGEIVPEDGGAPATVDGEKGRDRESAKKKAKKARNAILRPFRRISSHLHSDRISSCPSSSSSSYPYFYGDRPIRGCYLCFLPPPDAPGVAPPRDSKGLKVSSNQFVKNLLERNDFYAPECNVHRDIDCPEKR